MPQCARSEILLTPPLPAPPRPLVTQIAWVPRATDALLLLSLNDKSIKLWKVYERSSRTAAFTNVEMGAFGGSVRKHPSTLRIPPLIRDDPAIVASPRRIYSAAHAYHINSLSVCADGLHFITADDLRVNLWGIDHAQVREFCVNFAGKSRRRGAYAQRRHV